MAARSIFLFLVFLNLLSLCKSSANHSECHNKSLTRMFKIQFDKNRLACDPKSLFAYACHANIWRPSRVVCERDQEIDKDANEHNTLDESLALWDCKSFPEWIAGPELRCSSSTSPCLDSVFEKCFALYDPSDTLVYVLCLVLMFVMVILIFVCFMYGIGGTPTNLASSCMRDIEQGLHSKKT